MTYLIHTVTWNVLCSVQCNMYLMTFNTLCIVLYNVIFAVMLPEFP